MDVSEILSLLAVSEVQWRHAEMVFDVLAEIRGIGESESVANLLDAQVGLTQVVANVLHYMFRNPFVGGPTRVLLADGREVFRRDTEVIGVSFNRSMLYLAGV